MMRMLTLLKITSALVFLGIVIFDEIRHRREAEARAEAARLEAERDRRLNRNIMLAAQPLRSLELVWEFHGVPAVAISGLRALEAERMEAARRTIPAEGNPPLQMGPGYLLTTYDKEEYISAYNRYFYLYPWLRYITNGEIALTTEVVLLVGLDESGSAVLPIGVHRRGDGFPQAIGDSVEPSSLVSEFVEAPNNTLPLPPSGLGAKLEIDDNSVIFRWKVTPHRMEHSLNRLAGDLRPPALMPERLRLITLRSIELSHRSENFAHWSDILPWESPATGEYSVPWQKSTLKLRVNDVPDYVHYYSVHKICETPALNMPSSYDIAGFDVVVWEARRMEHKREMDRP